MSPSPYPYGTSGVHDLHHDLRELILLLCGQLATECLAHFQVISVEVLGERFILLGGQHLDGQEPGLQPHGHQLAGFALVSTVRSCYRVPVEKVEEEAMLVCCFELKFFNVTLYFAF